MREKTFTRTSLILVGHVLGTEDFDDSYLYDEAQAHVYRPKVRPAKASTVDDSQARPALKVPE